MWWVFMWMHHHLATTVIVGPKFGKLVKILVILVFYCNSVWINEFPQLHCQNALCVIVPVQTYALVLAYYSTYEILLLCTHSHIVRQGPLE